MLNAELTPTMLAGAVGVDGKTVNRWLTEDRVPYPVTRVKIARLLNQEETFLWPSLLTQSEAFDASAPQVDGVWPTRTAISSDRWHELFSRATGQLDILVYSGDFLIETLDLVNILTWKAAQGTSIRLLIGDPESYAVRQRAEELSEPWLPDRCRSMVQYLSGLVQSPCLQARAHSTSLHASHFRFDNVMLINGLAFAARAAESPVLRIRSELGSPLFDFYAKTYDRVWASGRELL